MQAAAAFSNLRPLYDHDAHHMQVHRPATYYAVMFYTSKYEGSLKHNVAWPVRRRCSVRTSVAVNKSFTSCGAQLVVHAG
jgi:hypothetical protein